LGYEVALSGNTNLESTFSVREKHALNMARTPAGVSSN